MYVYIYNHLYVCVYIYVIIYQSKSPKPVLLAPLSPISGPCFNKKLRL